MALLLLSLGHLDIQNPMIELGANMVLIDIGREVEHPVELSIAALAQPVPGSGLATLIFLAAGILAAAAGVLGLAALVLA